MNTEDNNDQDFIILNDYTKKYDFGKQFTIVTVVSFLVVIICLTIDYYLV